MVLAFGDFEIDPGGPELRRNGRRVPIQPKTLSLLTYLVRAGDRLVTRQEIHDSVWAGVTVSDASLARAVLEARRAIGDTLQQIIVTVRGRGFRFTLPVREQSERARGGDEPEAFDSFVGRAASMSALRTGVEDAICGRGKLVWIVGELGIGKTRLTEELARRARERGVAVLTAQAHERHESTPYALWAKIARACVELSPDAPPSEAIAPITSGERVPETAELRLFDAFARFVSAAAHKQPLLVVLEDMHWSDAASVRLLQYLGFEAREMPLLVVATCREGAFAGDERGRALAHALRAHADGLVPLRGVGVAEIERYVEAVTGIAPTRAFAQAVFERTGGNPLYIGQLLKTEWAENALNHMALEITTSIDLQQGLIQSIQRHLDALAPPARELLITAAALGREFKLAELLATTELARGQVLEHLDAAASARVISGPKNGAYRFTPSLVRDVVYKGLSSVDRERRHGRIAERLLAQYADALDVHAADLAYHFGRALPGRRRGAGDRLRGSRRAPRRRRRLVRGRGEAVAARRTGALVRARSSRASNAGAPRARGGARASGRRGGGVRGLPRRGDDRSLRRRRARLRRGGARVFGARRRRERASRSAPSPCGGAARRVAAGMPGRAARTDRGGAVAERQRGVSGAWNVSASHTRQLATCARAAAGAQPRKITCGVVLRAGMRSA